MGSTAKLIFGSILAISVVFMFLIFKMQESAQLSLDIKANEATLQAKDQNLAELQQQIDGLSRKISKITALNAIIPKLKQNLKTIEQEKAIYIQQFEDFQAELQSEVTLSDRRLQDLNQLQKELQNSRQQIANSEQDIVILNAEKVALADNILELQGIQSQLMSAVEQLENDVTKLTETVLQKDRVISIYKGKLDAATEEIKLLHVEESSEQLNLKLILDELAVKTALVNKLDTALKISDLSIPADKSENNDSQPPTLDEKTNELIKKLSLENDAMGLALKERDSLLEELQNALTSSQELLAANDSQTEQFQLLNDAKDEENRELQDAARTSEQKMNQLQATLNAKEKELTAAHERTGNIASPLTEKITGLELQLTQAANNYANLEESLTQAGADIQSLLKENKILNDELNSSQTAMGSLNEKTASIQLAFAETAEKYVSLDISHKELKANIQTITEKLDASQNALATKTEQLEALIQTLVDIEEANGDLNTFREVLSSDNQTITAKLDTSQETVVSQNEQITTLKQIVTEFEEKQFEITATAAELRQQLEASNSKIDEIQNLLEKTRSESSIKNSEQEERISRLIKEIGDTRANMEEKTFALEQLTIIANNLLARNDELLAALAASAAQTAVSSPVQVDKPDSDIQLEEEKQMEEPADQVEETGKDRAVESSGQVEEAAKAVKQVQEDIEEQTDEAVEQMQETVEQIETATDELLTESTTQLESTIKEAVIPQAPEEPVAVEATKNATSN